MGVVSGERKEGYATCPWYHWRSKPVTEMGDAVVCMRIVIVSDNAGHGLCEGIVPWARWVVLSTSGLTGLLRNSFHLRPPAVLALVDL